MRKIFILLILTVSVSCNSSDDSLESPWRIVGNALTAKGDAGIVVAGNKVYFLGGSTDSGYTDESVWSTLNSDGTFEGWSQATSFSEPRGYTYSLEHNGVVYAVGGANGDHGVNLLNTVERARINPDGSLGEWVVDEKEMIDFRRGVTAFIKHGYLYAIGGFNGTFLDSVERAKINPDGSLGEFELAPTLKVPRYIQSSVLVGDFIYVMGGHKKLTGGAYNEVEYAQVFEDGSLGEWHFTSPINIARYDGYAVAYKDYIYFVGGYDGKSLKEVERAKVLDDGTLSPWEIVSELSIARNAAPAFVYDNKIYSVGGSNNGRYLSSIEGAVLTEDGHIRSRKR